MRGKQRDEQGFTLLELLLVVAMLVLVAAIVLDSLNDVRLKGRDARRVADMREVEKALAIYHGSAGRFPIVATTTVLTSEDPVSRALEDTGAISQVPTDPLHDIFIYTYKSDASGSTYTLQFCLEGDSIEGFEPGCANSLSP